MKHYKEVQTIVNTKIFKHFRNLVKSVEQIKNMYMTNKFLIFVIIVDDAILLGMGQLPYHYNKHFILHHQHYSSIKYTIIGKTIIRMILLAVLSCCSTVVSFIN